MYIVHNGIVFNVFINAEFKLHKLLTILCTILANVFLLVNNVPYKVKTSFPQHDLKLTSHGIK